MYALVTMYHSYFNSRILGLSVGLLHHFERVRSAVAQQLAGLSYHNPTGLILQGAEARWPQSSKALKHAFNFKHMSRFMDQIFGPDGTICSSSLISCLSQAIEFRSVIPALSSNT